MSVPTSVESRLAAQIMEISDRLSSGHGGVGLAYYRGDWQATATIRPPRRRERIAEAWGSDPVTALRRLLTQVQVADTVPA